MIVNGPNLRTLGIAFNAAFTAGLGMAKPTSERVAMTVPSSTETEEYGWLAQIQSVRQWLGDRVVNNLSGYSYKITNQDYENTIAVPRNKIEDDNLGIYSTLFQNMGFTAAAHKEQLVWPTLQAGFDSACYDGQAFFSNEHPVVLPGGAMGVYANTDAEAGDGPPWFLLDVNRPIKPILFQDRKPFAFQAMDRVDDPNVFMRKEFLYGIDARRNVGFGLPQLCFGSTQPLNAANYSAARASMRTLTGDGGIKLGVNPGLLVVHAELEGAGLALLNADRDQYGATNVWKGTAELLVSEWLN